MKQKTLDTIIRVAVCLPLTVVLLPIYAISAIFMEDGLESLTDFATAWCNPDYTVFADK